MEVSQNVQVPRMGMEDLQNSQKFPARYTNVVSVHVPAPGYCYMGIPVPRVSCHGHTELKVPGTGMNVVQNLRKFGMRVILRVWSLTRVTFRL